MPAASIVSHRLRLRVSARYGLAVEFDLRFGGIGTIVGDGVGGAVLKGSPLVTRRLPHGRVPAGHLPRKGLRDHGHGRAGPQMNDSKPLTSCARNHRAERGWEGLYRLQPMAR